MKEDNKNDKKSDSVSTKNDSNKKEDNESKSNEKINTGVEIAKTIINVIGESVKSYFNSKSEENKNKVELEKIKLSKETMLLNKEINELKEKTEREEKEKNEKEQKKVESEEKWKNQKNIVIDSLLNEIDYLNLIKTIFKKLDEYIEEKNDLISDDYKILLKIYEEFQKEIDEKISLKIFKNDFKELYDKEIKEMHDSILKSIKNNIPEIETLNFMITGMSGAGKSTLTNVILKKDLSKEGHSIHSQTQEFKQYSNLDEVPGITIYDTYGVEPTNEQRNLQNTKEVIKKTFDENLKDPKKSLHGILYCINNGNSANRIEEGEIAFILELNRIYANCDILTIVFTQSANENTETRIKELKECLNNENIEIIPIVAKDLNLKIGKMNITIPKYGLEELIESMKKNAKKIVLANLKEITRKEIQQKYKKNINMKYNEIEKKLNDYDFEKNITKEFKTILKELFIDININFDDLVKVLLDYKEQLNEKIMEYFKKQYKDKSMNKINKEYLNINTTYNNQLVYDSSYEEYNFITKFEEFFKDKINESVNNILLGKASLIFLKRSKDFFSEILSENIKDEEIEDLANSNVEKILKKINKE